MCNALKDNSDEDLYKRSNLKYLAQLGKDAEAFKNYAHFSNNALKEGPLSVKLKKPSQLLLQAPLIHIRQYDSSYNE